MKKINFNSILFLQETTLLNENINPPECLQDLNLDQVFTNINNKKETYRLLPFFYTILEDIDSVEYRQDVFKDLESKRLTEVLNNFAEKMIIVRRYLGLVEKLRYEYHIKGWHLEAVFEYCSAVNELSQALDGQKLNSQGMLNFRCALSEFVHSSDFVELMAEASEVKNKLDSIEYSIIIKGGWVRVRKYQDEIDYSNKIINFFDKFRQGVTKDYRLNLVIDSGMSHVEAQILECVVKLYPEEFESLSTFYEAHVNFMNPTILRFDREIQFYLSYNNYIDKIRQSGLSFSFPEVSTDEKFVFSNDSFDIALADKYRFNDSEIICNDFYLEGKERIIIVSGPNQGGKTTFARMIGQLFYLGSLGCPVPGSKSKLLLIDSVFTHFEREENIQNLRGKLKDELIHMKDILDLSTGRSLIILNEILTSTSLNDATFISMNVIEKILQKDTLCVCVSFIDELSKISEETVSMVSLIDPDNPALRTFKIIRKPADGRAFAIHIAKKHGLTYEMIKEEIK